MPLWKWILLFIVAVFLAINGYSMTMGAYDMGSQFGYPGMSILGCVIVLGLYALFVRWFEGHWPKDLKITRVVSHTLLGLLVGLTYMVLVVSTIVALGDGEVSWQGFSWPAQWDAIMLFLAVAVGEELICRGVIFRWIDERWNTWAALAVSALIFGLGHLPNDNATWWSTTAIAIEAGLMLAVAYKWSGTLWVPIGIHWAWNYVQGNVFGLAVSGNQVGNSILATATSGPDLITGGDFGPEASILAVIFGVILTLVFLYNCRWK